jgi:hypothetical protein
MDARHESGCFLDMAAYLWVPRLRSQKMKARTVMLADQLLDSIPQDELNDLIRILHYYNTTFREEDRVKAVRHGSAKPKDDALEREVKSLQKTAGSQNVYVTTNQTVCRCCGR